jgi:isocitrate/isopropylmalate dehydrogenase
VIVCSKLFGDIVSDLVPAWRAASASPLGQSEPGAGVPVHVRTGARLGPDIYGKNIANPIAQISPGP